MAGGRQHARHGRFDRLHPFVELALLESDLADARNRLFPPYTAQKNADLKIWFEY
jgi:hypothetical protein